MRLHQPICLLADCQRKKATYPWVLALAVAPSLASRKTAQAQTSPTSYKHMTSAFWGERPSLSRKPEDYVAPEEIQRDPGLLWDSVLETCCQRPGDVAAIGAWLGVTRQSIWGWRKPGCGLPDHPGYLAQIQEALQSPASPLKLPLGVTLQELVQIPTPREGEGSGNPALLDLLIRIATSADPRFGHESLRRLAERMAASRGTKRARDPSILYKWGYDFGVPRFSLEPFIRSAIDLELFDVYPMRAKAFAAYVRKTMGDLRRKGE